MNKYEIIPSDDEEVNFQIFIAESKIPGYLYPNRPEGLVYHLSIEKDMATMLSLKFKLKTIRRLGPAYKVYA